MTEEASAAATKETRRELVEHFTRALEAVVGAIRVELAAGRTPRGKTSEPSVTYSGNGMPTISNGSAWEATGPLQYADLLEPYPPGATQTFKRKLEAGRIPEVDQFVDFVRANPGCAISIMSKPFGEEAAKFNLERIMIEVQLAHAANRFFQLYGDSDFDDRRRKALLGPILLGFFSERVNITTVVPIALVKFDFDRLRLSRDAYIIRMNDTLHRKRWSVKAYGASGHEGVVGAATHAFVITGWHWPNLPWIEMSRNLSFPDARLRERIDEMFGALRLVTGISTGYAQELRLAKGWSHLHTDDTPEVYAIGARRYPEAFDDFGWTREDIPTVTRAQMRKTAVVLANVRSIDDDRLALALRRLNTAMIRHEAADAILDATIGLEILLSDGDSQAISYKLRLRAAALSNLVAPGSATQVAAAIKGIYEARSRIVHGARTSKSKKRTTLNTTAADDAARDAALEQLRRVLMVVLEHPRFLDPFTIDAELLLSNAGPRDQVLSSREA